MPSDAVRNMQNCLNRNSLVDGLEKLLLPFLRGLIVQGLLSPGLPVPLRTRELARGRRFLSDGEGQLPAVVLV